ncbi:MAG: phosphoserine phosphatase SerB [Betaproteobacteria bacterium]|nr:phosphoserine phosphatase SerB [Betaproteobacteria bacterium]
MHLIIQGSGIETGDLKALAKASAASAIERISEHAFRLRNASDSPGIAAVCERARLDFALIPEHRKLAHFKLLVMDMDSTLITIETIDELADLVGLKREVAAITEQAMRGEIEYNESLRRRVAVLKGLDESALQRVYDERVRLSPGAEILLAACKQYGIKTLLVSGGFTHVTDLLKPRLGLDYTHSNTLAVANGKLTGEIVGDIVNADGKRDELLRIRDLLGIKREHIMGMGDGANDLKFMAECGVSIAYHAKPIVRGQTTHAINFGGLDAVVNLFN